MIMIIVVIDVMLFLLVIKFCMINFIAFFNVKWSFANFAPHPCLQSFTPGSTHLT